MLVPFLSFCVMNLFNEPKQQEDTQMAKINKVNSFVQYFEAQKRLIHELFDNDESRIQKLVKRQPKHPAVIQSKICDQIISQNGILKLPENQDIVPKLASILLDSYILTKVSGGNIADLSLGKFATYGDEKVRKTILSQIEDPNKFQELMTELYFGSWFMNKAEYILTATEDKGLADFKIQISNHKIPLIVDCKYIHSDSEDTRYIKNIDKANQQIKKWRGKLDCDVYGLVAMDISSKLISNGIDLEENLKFQLTKLKVIKELVQKYIKSNFSSVSGVLLIWDLYGITFDDNEASTINLECSRNSYFIKHSNPKVTLPENLIDLMFYQWGYQTGYKITFSARNN